jgi:uncharacterized protein (TIGR02246 family)
MTKNALRLTLVASAFGLVALTAGCTKPVVSDPEQAKKAISDTEVQWNADYKAKDLAKVSSHYASDATLMVTGGPLATGSDAIGKALKDFIADPALDIQFSADKVGVSTSGELGYTQGHFKLTATDPQTKKPATQTGSYVTIYRKEADGSWKAIEDIATPTVAAPPAPATPPAPPKVG